MTAAGHFECNRLMVSHSNEYRAPGDKDAAEKVDVRKLMRTLAEEDAKTSGQPAAPAPHATSN